MAKDMLEVLQERTTAKLDASSEALKALDPTMWVGLLTAVVQLLQECQKNRNSPAAVAKEVQHTSLRHRLKLRRLAIREVGRAKYRKHGDEIVEKMLAVGREAKPDEIELLVTQQAS